MHQTIVANALFKRGDRVAIAASGGKGMLAALSGTCSDKRVDSTVLARVLTELNRRHDYGLNLFMLSVDEGITGYRDDSLEVRHTTGHGYHSLRLVVHSLSSATRRSMGYR